VHARQTHAAVLDLRSGELAVRRLVGTPEEVVAFLERLAGPIIAVYEAGPTGFGLAREARRRRIDVRVVAPGSIPKGSGDRVKTSKFLLRRGQRYTGGSSWSLKHLRWLHALGFDDACSQVAFADYLASVELLGGRRVSLLAAIEQQAGECSHAPVIARLRCFRGIETLSAAGVCAEVGSFARFPKPTLLSGFLGIVPSERTSDLKRRQGSITKAGPGHARRLLVEAAHHYRHRPAIGETLARRQAGQDPRVIEIAWRAQRRLHQRWQRLHLERRKPAGVVAIAVARELTAFLWEAATLD
jgi:transposase